MTALSNSATGGDATFATQLGDSTAPADAELRAAVAPDSDAWRRQVAARLARYRTRHKPRAPRYPSLLLPFDTSDNWSRPVPVPARSPARGEEFRDDLVDRDAQTHVVDETRVATAITPHFSEDGRAPKFDFEAEPSAKIIEFPRSAVIPVFQPSPLADPILDRPRIVEAPEVMPPPPALGGILIEPAPQEQVERRAPADCLVQVASVSRRLLAAAIDGLILATALCAFGAIFWRLNPVRSPLPLLHPGPPTAGAPGTPLLVGVAGAIAVLLWMAYQLLFVVYVGATPGLRAACLRFVRFDGSPINRRARRWRVLASFLSAFSAGLGYFWCFLDQDSLCWHDRISRTYVQSVRLAE